MDLASDSDAGGASLVRACSMLVVHSGPLGTDNPLVRISMHIECSVKAV